jgi:phosphoglycerate dehydrogenase-like enzyme
VRTTTVAILDDYQDAALASTDWRESELGLDVTTFRDRMIGPALTQALQRFDVVVAMRERTTFDRKLLSQLPRLRLLVTTGMSNSAIDIAAAEEYGITVSGTRGLTSAAVELTWALIFAVVRNVAFEDARLRAGHWQSTLGTRLRGKTLGVVGLGMYGTEVARVGTALGLKVIAWSRGLDPVRAAGVGVTATSKDELFSTADIVSIHYRLSQRSRHLVGAPELGLMKPTSFLINTSRAEIVDTEALIDALRDGRIAGAGIDVYDREPLPPAHPVLSAPRTVLTPHLGFVTRENYEFFYTDAVKDIAAFLAGEPVRVLGLQRGTSA